MLLELGADGVSVACGQQVDRAVGGHVDQDGAVAVPAAQGEVVDAQDGDRQWR
jgi:hypothetical protein